jgi:predicted RNA-binding Zn ribbon-like protein
VILRNTIRGSLPVLPRYDLPNAAPPPLREVQLLLNSQDLEHEVDWLPDWLAERGLAGAERRARTLRAALRALVRANNGVPLEEDAVGVVTVMTDGDALDRIVAIALGAMVDGSWGRLKACRNCRWSFYDRSPNRSGTWCSMQLCGNRKKTRAYRKRQSAAR